MRKCERDAARARADRASERAEMGEIRRARNDRTDRGGTARREIRGGEATAGTEGCRGWNRSTRGRRVRNRSVNPKPVRNATRGSSANVDRAATPQSANPMRWRGARGGFLCRFPSLDTRGEKRRRGARTRSVRGSVNPWRATTLAGRTNERRGSFRRSRGSSRALAPAGGLFPPRPHSSRRLARLGVALPAVAAAAFGTASSSRLVTPGRDGRARPLGARRARAGRAGRGRSRARGVGPPAAARGIVRGRASGIRDDAAGSSGPSAPPAPASRERSPRRPRRGGGWGFVLGSSAPGRVVVIIRRGALINRCASSSSARGAAARPRPAAGERPPRVLLVGIDGGGSDPPPRAASLSRGEGGGVREGARAHLRRCVRGGCVARRRRARVLERCRRLRRFRRLPSGGGSPRLFARRKRKRETLGTPLALRLAAASLDRPGPGPGPGGARGRQGLPRGHARSRLRSRRDALLRAHSSDHGGPGVRDRFGPAGDPRGILRGF